MLCGLPLMLQAAFGDGLAFDPFSLQQDCLAASEVDVGRGQIVDALVIDVVVIVDECQIHLERSTRGSAALRRSARAGSLARPAPVPSRPGHIHQQGSTRAPCSTAGENPQPIDPGADHLRPTSTAPPRLYNRSLRTGLANHLIGRSQSKITHGQIHQGPGPPKPPSTTGIKMKKSQHKNCSALCLGYSSTLPRSWD
jgi:hypothetical protein